MGKQGIMSPRKLSEDDRQEILNLYRTTEETTSTLAVRFGVSSSTVSRFLKNSLSDLEYEDLIQEKRLARTTKSSLEKDAHEVLKLQAEQIEETIDEIQDTEIDNHEILSIDNEDIEPIEDIEDKTIDDQEILEMDNEAIEKIPDNDEEIEISEISIAQRQFVIDPDMSSNYDKPLLKIKEEITLPPMTENHPQEIISSSENPTADSQEEFNESADLDIVEEDNMDDDEDEDLDSVNEVAAMFGEDMDDDEDDDGDDDGDDDEDDDIESFSHKPNISPHKLQVLPLTKAVFPKVCYLVIDRYSELITKPLREFADLGDIPHQETLQRTLPVFDNHRVAKRFCDAKGTLSARKGKVIKVPDGKILQKTSSHLHAKGISRILMDGKIYSLIY